MTTSDRFPVPVRSAVKSNLTNWCNQNLSNRALNELTVLASAKPHSLSSRLSLRDLSELLIEDLVTSDVK